MWIICQADDEMSELVFSEKKKKLDCRLLQLWLVLMSCAMGKGVIEGLSCIYIPQYQDSEDPSSWSYEHQVILQVEKAWALAVLSVCLQKHHLLKNILANRKS